MVSQLIFILISAFILLLRVAFINGPLYRKKLLADSSNYFAAKKEIVSFLHGEANTSLPVPPLLDQH